MEYLPGLLRLAFLALIALFFMLVLRFLGREIEKNSDDSTGKEAYLVVLEAGDLPEIHKGHRFSLSDTATIGRNSDNSVILENSTVSKFHAVIQKKKDLYYISDAGSKNGTILNENLIEKETPLKSGDVVQIGEICLRFEME